MSFSGHTRTDYLGTEPKARKRSALEVKLAIGGGETSQLRDFRCHRSRSETENVVYKSQIGEKSRTDLGNGAWSAQEEKGRGSG